MSELAFVTRLAVLSVWSALFGCLVGVLLFFWQGFSLPIFQWDGDETSGQIWLSAQGVKIASTKQPPLPHGYVEVADRNQNEIQVVSYRFFAEEGKECVTLTNYNQQGKATHSTTECVYP